MGLIFGRFLANAPLPFSLGNPWHFKHIKNRIWWYLKEAIIAKECNSFHLPRKKLDYLHFKDFSITNVNWTLSNHLLHHNTRLLLLFASQTIDLPLRLDNGRISLSLEIIDHVIFALIMQLKMRHILCWNVPSITPLEISFHHYLF